MEESYMNCSNGVATDVWNLSTATRPLERRDIASARKGAEIGPNEHNTIGTWTRVLTVLCSELCRHCSFGRPMAAPTTRKILPFHFGLSFPRTAEAWYRFLALPDTIKWTSFKTNRGGAVPSVLFLTINQSTVVVRDTDLQ